MSVSTVETRFGSWETALEFASRIELVREVSKEEALRELEEISGVPESKAVALYENGFTSVADVKRATLEELTAVDGISEQVALRLKVNVGTVDTIS